MTTLEMLLILALFFVLALYITSKLRKNKKLSEIVNEVKTDLSETMINVGELVTNAKDIVFADTLLKAILEFIMIVEEKNIIAKTKGEQYLSGDEKKLSVISRLSEWIADVTGSVDKAVGYLENNHSKIETIIDDYVAFSNKMLEKAKLSEVE